MIRNVRPQSLSQWTLSIAFLTALGCATGSKVTPPKVDPRQEELEQARRQVQDLRDQVTTLNGRLEGMELKVFSLQEELKASRTSIETLSRGRSANDAEIIHSSAAESLGKPVITQKAPKDPDTAFVTDTSVDSFRKAQMLFDTKKYPESMLAFTSFLEDFADHPWAGAAQFQIGQCYFFQNECKLAIQEYQRVLTSYDRSSHVADALKQMARCEDELKLHSSAEKHRQLLTSLFPNSPAARELIASVNAPVTEKPEKSAGNSETLVNEKLSRESSIPPTAPAEGTVKQ